MSEIYQEGGTSRRNIYEIPGSKFGERVDFNDAETLTTLVDNLYTNDDLSYLYANAGLQSTEKNCCLEPLPTDFSHTLVDISASVTEKDFVYVTRDKLTTPGSLPANIAIVSIMPDGDFYDVSNDRKNGFLSDFRNQISLIHALRKIHGEDQFKNTDLGGVPLIVLAGSAPIDPELSHVKAVKYLLNETKKIDINKIYISIGDVDRVNFLSNVSRKLFKSIFTELFKHNVNDRLALVDTYTDALKNIVSFLD